MKAQFDPDVWAALLLIVAVGLGGVLFINLLVNSFSMHGLLSLLDREIDQKGFYLTSALSKNDYALNYENTQDKNYSLMESFYSAKSNIRKPSNYEQYIKQANESLANSPVSLSSISAVKAVCGFVAGENDYNKKFNECVNAINNEGLSIIYQYTLIPIYSPVGTGYVFIAFGGPGGSS